MTCAKVVALLGLGGGGVGMSVAFLGKKSVTDTLRYGHRDRQRQKERQRQRQTQRDRWIQTEIDSQVGRQQDRDRDGGTNRQTERQTDMQKATEKLQLYPPDLATLFWHGCLTVATSAHGAALEVLPQCAHTSLRL